MLGKLATAGINGQFRTPRHIIELMVAMTEPTPRDVMVDPACPPFAGSLDYASTSGKLQRVVKTKKTELLFMALFLQLLQPGGRAAVIVPDGVLFGSSNAHKELGRTLVEDHFLEAVVSLPSGVFRPYAGVSTAILHHQNRPGRHRLRLVL